MVQHSGRSRPVHLFTVQSNMAGKCGIITRLKSRVDTHSLEPPAVPRDTQWQDDLSEGLETGDEATQDTQVYVRLVYGTLLIQPPQITFQPTTEKILLLMTIWVPGAQRHQGVATRIVEYLEARAERERVRFAVGPILEDDDGNAFMSTLCETRGYCGCMPWCYYLPKSHDVEGGLVSILVSSK